MERRALRQGWEVGGQEREQIVLIEVVGSSFHLSYWVCDQNERVVAVSFVVER